MSIKQNLRAFQDQQRDEGWRIKWIPWQAVGRPEKIYNTPSTRVLGLTGGGLFVGGLLSCLWLQHYRMAAFVLAMAGLLLILLTRLYASWHQHHDWIDVRAVCLDSEILKGYAPRHPGLREIFELRMLCRFSHGGQTYTVTPEINMLSSFTAQEAAADFLTGQLGSDQTCTLQIDPQNPLHAQVKLRGAERC